MSTLTDFFLTLYSALEHPERYQYEIRSLKADPNVRPLTMFLSHATLRNLMQSPVSLNLRAKNEQGYNIYFGINPRRGKRGDKAHIAACVALYADIDVKDFLPPAEKEAEDIEGILAKKPEVCAWIKETYHARNIPPTLLVDSGRGFQLYWLLDPPVLLPDSELEPALWAATVAAVEGKNKALAAALHGDHIGNIDRIFRLPAFANRKPVRKGAAELTDLPVQILACEPTRRYAFEAFPLPDAPTNDGQETAAIIAPAATVSASSLSAPDPSPLTDADRAVLAKARAAKNGRKFARLFEGDWRGYGYTSQSVGEWALVSMLAYWTHNDRAQIDRLFRHSKLYRPKWETPFSGTTNGWYTIDKVLAQTAPPAVSEPYIKVTFWYESVVNEGQANERVELHIDYRKFLDFLEQNGFGLLITDKQVQIIRVKENIVSQTLKDGNMNLTIKQFTMAYLRAYHHDEVLELMLRRHGTFFTTAFLTSLNPLRPHFYRDNLTRCTLFFRNGYIRIEVTAQGVRTAFDPYANLSAAIWESHVQPRDYRGAYHDQPLIADDERESVFEQFLNDVSVEMETTAETATIIADNLKPFKYAFAYLLHDYKDYANARAVICVDNDAARQDANGGRGKTVFGEALKYLRKVSVEDGRTLKLDNNQFLFQTLDLDSQVLMIDDAKPKFDFSQLYTVITGSLALERKRENRMILPFEQSPKILITTNHAILGSGASHVRRWQILPFTSYFNIGWTPMDQFKQRLFIEWDAPEWSRFDDFAIACLEQYFTLAVPPVSNLTTYNESKLKSALPAELLDYFDEYLGELPYEVPKKTFMQDFRASYPIYDKSTQNWFTGRLTVYCEHRGIRINPGTGGGRVWRVLDVNGQSVKTEYLIFVKEKNDETIREAGQPGGDHA